MGEMDDFDEAMDDEEHGQYLELAMTTLEVNVETLVIKDGPDAHRGILFLVEELRKLHDERVA